MSMTDYRKLIDLHGGAFIGIECTDGVTIHIGINGDTPAKLTAGQVTDSLLPRLRARMLSTLRDGFKKFEFGFGGTSVDLTYYDAGLVLDSLTECVEFLT